MRKFRAQEKEKQWRENKRQFKQKFGWEKFKAWASEKQRMENELEFKWEQSKIQSELHSASQGRHANAQVDIVKKKKKSLHF